MAIDDSPSILDELAAHLGPDTIQSLSQQLGTDTAATSSAISMMIPILLGGLSKNAASAEGAASLDTALTAHNGGILDNLGGLSRVAGGGVGAAILGHILGSRRAPVEQGVARATGMNAQQVGQLLMMMAPVVMGVLGRMKQHQNVGVEQLPEVLGQASLSMTRDSPAVGELSRIFDSNHDGQIADDVARIGASLVGGLFGTGNVS
ncbi:MAG: DUF937 domain-containing protein [Thermoanaerobaculia bacterium]